MNDALTVRVVEGIGNVGGDGDRTVGRERSLKKTVRERLPLEVFHHEEVGPVVMAEVIERTDVRMIEKGNRASFPVETAAVRRIHADAFA
jgi:hypothetical protein